MLEAIAISNRNNKSISAGAWRLYGTGRWSGQLVDDEGKRHRVHNKTFKLSAVYPYRVSFKAAHLPETNRAFEVGCNEDVAWFWLQFEADECRIATRSSLAELNPGALPVRPDALIDALGIQMVDPEGSGPDRPLPRAEHDELQLLFEGHDEYDEAYIMKEFWLSRYEPFLINRVLYRDAEGRVIMDARLSDYHMLENDAALAAHHIDIRWPQKDWELDLKFKHMKRYEGVDHHSFVQPDRRVEIDPRQLPPKTIIQVD